VARWYRTRSGRGTTGEDIWGDLRDPIWRVGGRMWQLVDNLPKRPVGIQFTSWCAVRISSVKLLRRESLWSCCLGAVVEDMNAGCEVNDRGSLERRGVNLGNTCLNEGDVKPTLRLTPTHGWETPQIF
jgi:hypothetical protein